MFQNDLARSEKQKAAPSREGWLSNRTNSTMIVMVVALVW